MISDYSDYLLEQVPYFDKAILEDIRTTDPWVEELCKGPIKPMWFITRDVVRQLSEGIAFTRSPDEDFSEDQSILFKASYPRFHGIYPDLAADWNKIFRK